MTNTKTGFFTFYRLSDRGNGKKMLQHATKLYCLENYLSVFGKENLFVIADNCERETISKIEEKGVVPLVTALGNSGSFLYALDLALTRLDDEDYVYFVEDDYLHLPGSRELLKEGLEIADYATVYDHPDKYVNFSGGGSNPFVQDGGELSRVLLTKSTHWKETNSTPMTFAVSVKILREDQAFWKGYKKNSFRLFCQLRGEPRGGVDKIKRILFGRRPKKPRRIVSSIPGRSTHCETAWLSPFVDWTKV